MTLSNDKVKMFLCRAQIMSCNFSDSLAACYSDPPHIELENHKNCAEQSRVMQAIHVQAYIETRCVYSCFQHCSLDLWHICVFQGKSPSDEHLVKMCADVLRSTYGFNPLYRQTKNTNNECLSLKYHFKQQVLKSAASAPPNKTVRIFYN